MIKMHSYIGHAYQTSSEDAASAVYAIGLGINLSFHTSGLRSVYLTLSAVWLSRKADHGGWDVLNVRMMIMIR